jgi:excinuclease ABC subunit B
VGINLLREGLDIPEVSLVAILDADKEGFLRSERSLIQTAGRAARNVDGMVIMYADHVTDSLKRAMEETERRREKQMAFNKEHGITPETIRKNIPDILSSLAEQDYVTVEVESEDAQEIPEVENIPEMVEDLTKEMFRAARDLEFETAARLRDRIRQLENSMLSMG